MSGCENVAVPDVVMAVEDPGGRHAVHNRSKSALVIIRSNQKIDWPL